MLETDKTLSRSFLVFQWVLSKKVGQICLKWDLLFQDNVFRASSAHYQKSIEIFLFLLFHGLITSKTIRKLYIPFSLEWIKILGRIARDVTLATLGDFGFKKNWKWRKFICLLEFVRLVCSIECLSVCLTCLENMFVCFFFISMLVCKLTYFRNLKIFSFHICFLFKLPSLSKLLKPLAIIDRLSLLVYDYFPIHHLV